MFGRKKKEAGKEKSVPETNTAPVKPAGSEQKTDQPEIEQKESKNISISKPLKIAAVGLVSVLIVLAAFVLTRKVLVPQYRQYKTKKELVKALKQVNRTMPEADSVSVQTENDSENAESEKEGSENRPTSIVLIILAAIVAVSIISLTTFYISRRLLMPSKTEADEDDEAKPAPIPLAVKVTTLVTAIIMIILAAFLITKMIVLPQYREYKVKKELIDKTAEKKKPKKEISREMGQIFEIKDLTVNTFGSGGRRFLVAEFALETHSDETYDELGVRAPQIRDMIINYLRHYSADEILSLSFQENSRSELTRKINSLLYSGEIDSLYFSTLVLQ